MIWKCHDIAYFYLYFLSRNNGKREQLDERDLRRCCGSSFLKYLDTMIIAMFEVLSQQLWGTLTTACEKHLPVEGFMDMDQHRCWAYSSKNMAPRDLTLMLLLFSKKLSFRILPSVDRRIFDTICLPFYLSIFCVSWGSSSTSKLFLIRTR